MKDEAKSGPEAKRGMSGASKVLLGCGCLGVLGILVCAGAIGVGAWYGINAANEFAQPFEEDGYQRVNAQQLTVFKPVESTTVYFGQQVSIKDGSTASLAFACQMVELHGTIEGDVDFLGQVLHIKSDAVVKGDVHVKSAQVVIVEGEVQGEVTGSYQVLDDKRGKVGTGKAKDETTGEAAGTDESL